MTLFSLKAYALHHQRAQKTFHNHDFLYSHVAEELMARAREMQRDFEQVLDLSSYPVKQYSRVAVSQYTSVAEMQKNKGEWKDRTTATLHNFSTDEVLPFPSNAFDLTLSCFQAHWVNDLPKYLKSICQSLKPQGLFIGAFLGGNTLQELRESLLQAELSLKGGASPRISPMIQTKDAPLLLSQAGFINPVVDTEVIQVSYSSLVSLMKDLRGMGEANKLEDRLKTCTSRQLFEKAEEIYRSSYNAEKDKILATFEVIYLTGWSDTQ
jgi:NADH dehydrogenase [ubiquinone] 1 alpha subcomplex assembly factor 5